MARILVIDDDELVLATIEAILQEQGYEITTAINGGTVVELVQSLDPALVITDILMPGTEGIETIQLVKRAFPELPILAISGASGRYADYLNVAMKLGAAMTLNKPFTRDELCKAVAFCISE